MSSYTKEQVKDLISRAPMGDEDANDALSRAYDQRDCGRVINCVGQQIEGAGAGDLDEPRKMTQAWADYLDGS